MAKKMMRRASHEHAAARTVTADTKIDGSSTNDVEGMLDTLMRAQSEHDGEIARADKVEAIAHRKFEKAQRAEHRKPRGERTRDKTLWEQAYKEAKKEERSERLRAAARYHADRAAKATANTIRGEASSLWARNKKLTAPWLIAAPYAAVGEVAALAADQPGAIPAGIAAATGGLAALGSWLGYRTGWKLGDQSRHRPALRERTPAKFKPKVQAGMGMAAGWDTAMPLVHGAAGHTGMWLALLTGTAYMGLSWWHEYDHPIPEPLEPGTIPTPAPAPVATENDQLRRVNQITADWAGKVAADLAPGSRIEFHGGSIEAVLTFVITLDPHQRTTRKVIKQQLEPIAMKLDVFEDRLSFETGQRPTQLLMHVREADPVFVFDEPIVLCDGQPIQSRWEVTPDSTVDIVFGLHIDGSGYAYYRFLEAGSVNGAFMVGGMGSGKTKTLEIIAIGLRLLGCYLLWIDGQGGASSALLNQHANEVFGFNMHSRDDDAGVREFTDAIGAVTAERNRQLREDPSLGGAYTYNPARPPVVGLMDEAHELFQTRHATEGTYGHRLGAYASQVRKTGTALVGLSQDYDKTNTFGGSSRLREGLVTSGNFIGMRQTDPSRKGMWPSECPPLDAVPARGYGYLPFRGRPDAMWRTLDLGATVAEANATLERWIVQYEPGQLEFDRDTNTVPAAEPSATNGPGNHAPVRFAFGPASAPESPAESNDLEQDQENGAALTAAEQRALDALLEEGGQTPTSLGKALGKSSQGVGRQLQALADKGYAVRTETGMYRALTGTGNG